MLFRIVQKNCSNIFFDVCVVLGIEVFCFAPASLEALLVAVILVLCSE